MSSHTDVRRIDPAQLVVFRPFTWRSGRGTDRGGTEIAGLILESAFPSVAAMAKSQFNGLPAHWLLSSRFPLIERMKSIHVPLLMIHGDQDTIVPFPLKVNRSFRLHRIQNRSTW